MMSSDRSVSEKMHDLHNRFEMGLILRAWEQRHKRSQRVLELQQDRSRQTLLERVRNARQH